MSRGTDNSAVTADTQSEQTHRGVRRHGTKTCKLDSEFPGKGLIQTTLEEDPPAGRRFTACSEKDKKRFRYFVQEGVCGGPRRIIQEDICATQSQRFKQFVEQETDFNMNEQYFNMANCLEMTVPWCMYSRVH